MYINDFDSLCKESENDRSIDIFVSLKIFEKRSEINVQKPFNVSTNCDRLKKRYMICIKN